MEGNSILLLLVAAALVLAGVFLVESLDSMLCLSTSSRLENCQNDHPDWHRSVCEGIAEGRYDEEDVTLNASWDWEAIGAGRIRSGMSEQMIIAAWGEPDYVNPGGYVGCDEEWACGGHLLQFRNGMLSAIVDAQIWSVYNILSSADRNAVDYENRTQGERVFIAGRIAGIDSDYDGSPRVRFGQSDYWDEVLCVFSPALRAEIGALWKGQFVVILGTGAGVDILGPVFTSCRVFSSSR